VTIVVAVEAQPESVAVPDLDGMTRESAEQALNGVGLVPNFMGNPLGMVVSQSPQPGESVEIGSTVDVRLG
jgi:serine/threonine-protein kinase